MTAVLAIVISSVSLGISGYTLALRRSLFLFRQGKRDWVYRKDRPR